MSRLFLLPGAVRRTPDISRWMREQPADLAAIARRWFTVIRRCGDDVREVLHDDHPTACVDDAAFAYVDAFTAHVNVGFYQGATLADPSGLLEGTGKFMRHVSLRPGDGVDDRELERLIQAAYADMTTRCRFAHLDDVVVRVDQAATWKQVKLPVSERQCLRTVARTDAASARVLFVGPGGTGKTLAAAALANERGRDLFRIDVSRVVSQYIGETEKNLRRLVDAAEASGAILFFDEADALFGKRTDPAASGDRYANGDVSYLIERVDSFQGVAILATSARKLSDADAARFQCVVGF